MAQNMQNDPRTSPGLHPLNAGDDDPLAQADTLKILACPICRAIYISSSRQQTAHSGSATLLETAFLDVCRFCFRCQRPACPQCWNPMHHVCSSCSEEAQLPFRSPVPSLEGLAFFPPASSQTAQATRMSFTCLRNGRFYTPEPVSPPLESPQCSSVPTPSDPVTSDALPTVQKAPAPSTEASSYPTWLQEVLGQKPGEQSAPSLPHEHSRPIDPRRDPSWPGQAGLMAVFPQTGQVLWPQMPALPQPPAVPLSVAQPLFQPPALPSLAGSQMIATAQQNEQDDEDIPLLERVENVLIVVTSVLLLIIILMIVLALCFADVNTFFFHLLHIDIRTEIAYLLQLR